MQLSRILDYLMEHDQLDPRYIKTHYLSSVTWKSTFIADQSLESIQVTFAFELLDRTLSRKRVASSEPALRPNKECHHESTFWTDTSNQSLLPAPSQSGPSVSAHTPKRKSTRSVVTCMTPRLTDSGMAEYGVFSNPAPVTSSDFNREFEKEIEPAMEVVREIENEEEEKERQLVLDSQQRRDVELEHQNHVRVARERLVHDLQTSLATENEISTESEIQYQRLLESSRRAVAPSDLSRELYYNVCMVRQTGMSKFRS